MSKNRQGVFVAFGSTVGLAAATQLLLALVATGTPPSVGTALVVGCASDLTLRRLGCAPRVRLLVDVGATVVAALVLGRFVLGSVDIIVVGSILIGATVTWTIDMGRRRTAAGLAVVVPALVGAGMVVSAGAWSVDEPPVSDLGMVIGNGVVVGDDTHAFLIQQGDIILRNDRVTTDASFLESADPTAPHRRDADGTPLKTRESYLWRVQLGSRDADRLLKQAFMPDHFFNWWTHSGKGLIAGTSSATWAEQQFAEAVQAWHDGDRATAMYHLGAATHLVGDACAPPHASPFVPDHRAYEEWMLANQSRYAVDRGGIYRSDFRVHTGHGGDEWSSAHTRGWVDECAHRAAALVINTAQPPPDDPAGATSYLNTVPHFRDAQRLTAGYLAFFFESVAGP